MFPRVLIALIAARLLVSAMQADTSAIEREFARERKTLTCVNGSTDEPSCGGTDMDVYLRGDEVRKLNWWVEKGNQWVREEYYFRGTRPVLVIETIEKKYDSHAEPLPKPQLVSRTRYRLDQPIDSERIKEFFDHAEFLLRDFQKNRSSFCPCIRPHLSLDTRPHGGNGVRPAAPFATLTHSRRNVVQR